MENYSFWVYVPDGRVFAVLCQWGEPYAAMRVSAEDPKIHQASEFKEHMTLGAGDWIREEIDSFKEYMP